MSGVFEHSYLSGFFGDDEMSACWSASRTIQHMCVFESAWSRALGAAGMFDSEVAELTAQRIESAELDIEDLHNGMARDGVVVPNLVAQLKKITGGDALHVGATSQDVIDTALVLALRDTSDLIEKRLIHLGGELQQLENLFGDAPLTGRTRMQAATMITVADRIQPWRISLQSHLQRLEQLRARVEKVQVGGASGDRADIAEHEEFIVSHVANALGLAPTERAWHVMRDGIAEYASLLSLISGTLGKMGQDITLMAQQGIDEIELTGGGGSSAMPYKQNPVLAELLVTLARFNSVQVAGMHQAMVHEQERSGVAWSLEWMILPQMANATGRALTASIEVCNQVVRIGKK